jgi:glucans biosynthesis protein
MFDYGANGDTIGAALPEHLGFAGFRLHYPVHRPDYKDEIASFLGAAYFRMVGRNQRYGMSMRGIAIDTASPSGEIFPRFTKFWLVKPAPDENRMRLLALLDSASLTGAFTFEIESRNATTIRVRSRLFARRDVGKLGVAPLTSMFAWGENRGREFDDYRPEVHDSDGLLQHTGSDEWIWRPLVNPPTLQVSELLDPASRGYGLIQRDRAFEHFQDPAARFEQRPGIWVTPGEGDWTRGAVQLVEIPSPNEENDNIAAFWVGAEPLRAGETREFSYELRTVEGIDNPAGLATVVATRNGRAASAATPRRPPRSERAFTVDFAGGELTALTASQPVTAELAITRGRAAAVTVTRLPIGNTWRVSFRLRPADQQQLVNMRLFLTLRGRRVSETWNYLFSPESIAAR